MKHEKPGKKDLAFFVLWMAAILVESNLLSLVPRIGSCKDVLQLKLDFTFYAALDTILFK